MLSGCTDVLQSADSVKSYYEFSDKQFVNDLQEEAKTGAYKADEHDTKALASMKEMLSNEYISLYMGEYYDIAVLDKETGKIFFSNRAIYENADELSDEGKADAFSQVTIEYYDGASAQNTMSSYPDRRSLFRAARPSGPIVISECATCEPGISIHSLGFRVLRAPERRNESGAHGVRRKYAQGYVLLRHKHGKSEYMLCNVKGRVRRV